ncbi:MAG: hypothetical protein L0271_21425 [Gemmatimonadetes bacterium]|nr:hypothetical protein [Gemmatimonadota bacterium]
MSEPRTFHGARPGFAIPLALMMIVFLTAGVATTFIRIDGERRADQDRHARIDAFNYAQMGLERFATERPTFGFTTMPPAPYESTTIALPGGSATVVLRRVKQKTLTRPALYIIRSRAVKNAGNVAWMPAAEQTAAQYTIWREGNMDVIAGWTSLSGILKNGGAGTMTGTDGCGVMPTVAGVAVSENDYTQNGGGLVPTGNPNILDLGPQATANTLVQIDWNGILNNNTMPPDIVIPPASWPSVWPAGWWPVIRVNGDFSLPSSGRGTLVVTGDLTLSGSRHWEGIVLVGGLIVSNGTNNVQGATVSGLNEKLGINVGVSDVANGTKTFQYNSCNILSALSRYSTLVLMEKTWSDNWRVW